MLKLLDNKINELSSEARSIINERDNINDRLNQIDIRLHQIAGAMLELQKIIGEIQDETSKSN